LVSLWQQLLLCVLKELLLLSGRHVLSEVGRANAAWVDVVMVDHGNVHETLGQRLLFRPVRWWLLDRLRLLSERWQWSEVLVGSQVVPERCTGCFTEGSGLCLRMRLGLGPLS